ncbi:hypothetical protein RHOER0001_5933 [Rhodococcus erythropolis SK121]|nr:hypothetical protein RHOER0001_5933 [Rhodococcus erythropolis SK121]
MSCRDHSDFCYQPDGFLSRGLRMNTEERGASCCATGTPF